MGSRAWPCCTLQGEFLWLFGVKPSLPYRPAAALKGFVRVVGQDIALLAEIRRGRPQMGWLLGTLCLISWKKEKRSFECSFQSLIRGFMHLWIHFLLHALNVVWTNFLWSSLVSKIVWDRSHVHFLLQQQLFRGQALLVQSLAQAPVAMQSWRTVCQCPVSPPKFSRLHLKVNEATVTITNAAVSSSPPLETSGFRIQRIPLQMNGFCPKDLTKRMAQCKALLPCD